MKSFGQVALKTVVMGTSHGHQSSPNYASVTFLLDFFVYLNFFRQLN